MEEPFSEETDQGGQQRLRRINAEYEARLTEIAELTARVRHEINNPLTGLIGQAQLLLREELSDTARRRVQTIEHLAGRIRDTVAELRDVQRPHALVASAASPAEATTANNDESINDAPPRH
ncbi:MAG: histidine kinase dimerization/phospho-acceptor domain-containing protein [Pyrinomonadaceae bacterium]